MTYKEDTNGQDLSAGNVGSLAHSAPWNIIENHGIVGICLLPFEKRPNQGSF